MLAVALFSIAIIGLAAGVALEGGLGFARVSARHAAAHYAQIGLAQARLQLQNGLAAQIAAGTRDLQAPAALSAAPACESTPCPFTLAAVFALQGALGDNGSPNVVATSVQPYPTIAEGRIAATITETVSAADGATLAVRTEYVTLRTFGVSPYVAIDGMTDASAARDVPLEGDAGGCDPTTPSTCDASNTSNGSTPAPVAVMNPGDTRIHALTECVAGGTGSCAQQFVSADPVNHARTERMVQRQCAIDRLVTMKLIETIVCVAIVVILTAALGGYALGRKAYAIRAAVQSFAAFLDDARAVAQTSGDGSDDRDRKRYERWVYRDALSLSSAGRRRPEQRRPYARSKATLRSRRSRSSSPARERRRRRHGP